MAVNNVRHLLPGVASAGKAMVLDANKNITGVGTIGTTAGVGTLAAVTGLSVAEYGSGSSHRTVITFNAVSISTTDNGTAGAAGGRKIYTFPQGYIAIQGVSLDEALVTVDGTGLTSTAALEVGVGTTVANSSMASLTGTTEDIVTGKTFTLSTSLSATHQYLGSVSGSQAIDGSVTAKDAYLNVACSVATSAANGTLVLTGTLTILWQNVGAASA